MTESTSQEFRHPAVSEVCLGDLPSAGPSLRHSALMCGGRQVLHELGSSLGMWASSRHVIGTKARARLGWNHMRLCSGERARLEP